MLCPAAGLEPPFAGAEELETGAGAPEYEVGLSKLPPKYSGEPQRNEKGTIALDPIRATVMPRWLRPRWLRTTNGPL
jgi:hypothetical protein